MSDYPEYLAERDYYDSILGPFVPKQDKPVKRPPARGEGYPWTEGLDYDPRFDEDQEDFDE